MLQVEDLSFQFSNQCLLKQISFSVKNGTSVAILGASGSGKTTLFKLLTGLLSFQKGLIAIQGKPPKEARHLISYMMQDDLLLPWKTVLENVCLAGKLGKATISPLMDAALALLERVGLLPYASYYPHQLSGGMRQRASLARALLLNKPYLLLDEPFCSVDSLQKKELHHLVLELQKERKMVFLLITHDIFEAYALCDQVFFLSEGILIEGIGHEDFQRSFLQQGMQAPLLSHAQRSSV
jgi:NitT/TauT family transport system ATP-binding protein